MKIYVYELPSWLAYEVSWRSHPPVTAGLRQHH
jgi:hypothetical protein